MKRSIAGSLMLAALFLTAADCKGGPTGDTNPRPSVTACDKTPAGCPMKTGIQPAPSDAQSPTGP